MVYKMERASTTFERGDSGVGKIRFSKKGNKVQVLLQVKTGKDQTEEKSYVLDKDQCPDNIELARNGTDWMCQMSSQGDKLMSFRPVQGVFVVKTQSFAGKENEEPSPKSKDVDFMKDGKHIKYSYEYFTVILEVVEPEKFKSLTLPLVLHYNFGETVRDGKSYAIFSMGGKYTNALEEYMIVSGIMDDKYMPLDWKDNLLPILQRIALHEDKKFQVTVKDGWIVSGSLIPFDEPVEAVPFDEDDVKSGTKQTPPFVEGSFDPDEDEIPMEFED